ncbi:peptidoglycan bridge formation glycyltransferase FemA/FemB family protein [candidate division WWE3 bacterium]|nr:peptidoglycan bridge formation glycyltransferase FemA/FemB family protein [candidate division WWE3 bacterium]
MHIMQSPIWEQFKNAYGTTAIRVENTLYTKHRIPFTNSYYAYCPKADPFKINFDVLRKSLAQNNCIAINFDVPNIVDSSEEASEAMEIFTEAGCKKAPRDTFTPYNLILDLTPSKEDLLKNMHSKQRYNVRYAKRKGVEVREEFGKKAFEIFYDLAIKTAERQGFYIHPKTYYEKMWETLGNEGVAHILNAYYKDEPLASWMFFVYDEVLYYPYGGSAAKLRNLQASTLVGWEGMLLGKRLGCKTFDLWGACEDPNDRSDPEWGFTHFKQKFGAKHVKYIPSYDLVLNPFLYESFNFANRARWTVLNFKKQFS